MIVKVLYIFLMKKVMFTILNKNIYYQSKVTENPENKARKTLC